MQLIVGGYVMVGAILTNQSPVTLKDVTPIARLTGEYEAIVVPAASDIKTMADLVAKLKADPGAVSWGGGSAGGTDHIAVGLIAKAAGVDPTKINYIAFSGGGEALAAILGGQVTAGISGYGEFESQIKAGRCACSPSPSDKRRRHRCPDAEGSRHRRQMQNWRMVAAAPGLTPEQKAAVTRRHRQAGPSRPAGRNLKTKGWADTYLAGDASRRSSPRMSRPPKPILKDIGLVK
jgi:putative tricarboxylic transport membrane protein